MTKRESLLKARTIKEALSWGLSRKETEAYYQSYQKTLSYSLNMLRIRVVELWETMKKQAVKQCK